MKKVISLIAAAILLLAATVPALATRRTNYKPTDIEKHYSTLTIDDDFEDDVIYVTFNKETSRKLLEYSPQDFPEINCVKVEDTTLHDIKAILKGEEGYRPGEELYSEWISIDDYNQVLRITLAVPGKQNVLDAIKLLEQRDDVLGVDPESIVYCLAVNEELFVEPEIPGDIDGDGKVNARDVVALMRLLANGTNAEELPVGDVNNDGKLNARDIVALMRLAVE